MSDSTLSQDEIDQLLIPIQVGDSGFDDFRPAADRGFDLDDLARYLTDRKPPKDTYGCQRNDWA
jgi:hypothetical protein